MRTKKSPAKNNSLGFFHGFKHLRVQHVRCTPIINFIVHGSSNKLSSIEQSIANRLDMHVEAAHLERNHFKRVLSYGRSAVNGIDCPFAKDGNRYLRVS